MADGRIYITITDEPVGEGGGESGGNNEGASKITSSKRERALKVVEHQALHFVLSEAKQAINYSVSHIGVRTGNYFSQENAQRAVNMAYKGVGIGFSAVAGAKLGAKIGAAGGPWGAVIGAGVGLLTTATNVAHEWYDYQRQIRFQNREIEMLRQRAGLDINNGSR